MNKCLVVFACLILLSVVLIPQPNVYSQRREAVQRYAEDRIVVKLKAGVDSGLDADLMAEEIVRAPGARAEVLTTRRHDGARLIHLNRGLSVEDAVRRAKDDPRVEYAEPDYFVYAMDRVPDDPFFPQMWGLSNAGCLFCDPGQPTSSIDAAKAWDITRGSDDIVAVVLDTGVQLEHEDLAANAWVNPREIAGNGVDDDGNGFVDDLNGWNFADDTNLTFKDGAEDFHGTHVAGSIGAVSDNGRGVTGVAWHVKLMSLKFLHITKKGITGVTSDAVRGIYYAIDMRNRGVNVRVINASWGGGKESQSLRQAIADANNAGILFVCAAGNGDPITGRGINIDDAPDFPATYSIDQPNAISVAAVTQGGALASFSNYGHASVSVGAPGVSIYSTYPGTYRQMSGTSMATPYVSGIAVLLWSHQPLLSPKDVKERIVDTSQPMPSLVSMLARSGRASAYDALIDNTAPRHAPEVLGVHFSKKVVTIDGFGFVNGSAIIEVEGEPLPTVDYNGSFALANGTLTQLTANLGKKPLKRTFPSGVAVSVKVFNPTTGERSDRFTVARF